MYARHCISLLYTSVLLEASFVKLETEAPKEESEAETQSEIFGTEGNIEVETEQQESNIELPEEGAGETVPSVSYTHLIPIHPCYG